MIILEGVSGFWIQNGQISFPVYEITIAGNLKEMFQNIVSIGTDEYRRGAKLRVSVNRDNDYWWKLVN